MNDKKINRVSSVTPAALERGPGGETLNRVATSSLITLDLEEYYVPGERAIVDLKDILFQGLILREKDLRDFIKDHPWENYKDEFVAVTCTADAIVPTWAFMLIASSLQPFAAKIVNGSLQELENELFREALLTVDWQVYQDAKVVIKGCSKVEVPIGAYVHATTQLRKVAASIMYGEPCSTVPIFKAKKSLVG